MAQINPLGRSLAAHALAHRTDDRVPLRAAGVVAPGSSRPDVDLYRYIEERGFHFPRELVTRYLVALRTKPFALFTGISGTGKTKLALLVAEYFSSVPGTRATRREQPDDGDHDFYLPIDRVTLRSGTITPGRDQLDYFNVPAGATETFTANITNVLGAHGDITFRVSSLVAGGTRHLTVQVPSSVRRAFEQTGVGERDYLRFEIVEEFKRFRVSLFRPERELVDIPPEDRYAFVSVRPSWDDHTALLGSWDTGLERYVRTPVLELLLRAAREEADARAAGVAPAPYFVVLDEMNIARIEHYFSDFLSALESRRADASGAVRQEPLHLHGADAARVAWTDHLGIEYEVPERLAIPTNVVFTGTLNLDDTTWGVSPKVVDRASTIAFSAVDYAGFLAGAAADQAPDPLELPQEATRAADFLGSFQLATAEDSHEVGRHLGPFVQLNELLVTHGQHYGYRVLNDVALYVRTVRDMIGDSPETMHAAVDACVLQKVLPKFFPWREDRGGLLVTLLEYCLDGETTVADGVHAVDRDALLARVRVDHADRARHADGRDAWMPRSAGRLVRMLRAIG
ncbi:MAG: 5-methylcytosine-specific restriction related enzyme [Thermoleophilia bacterium]|nr:5-methylcytosine-specific restriction related enzyme [Thermoleophilia bacterium]